MLSQSVEDALRAVLYLASRAERYVPVSEIAEAVHASRSYLAKVLGQLAASGMLTSSRGTAGGFRLAVSPDTLTLAGIASALDGAERRKCLLGHGICGEVPGCPAHQRWAPVADAMDGFFADTTVSDLLRSDRSLSPRSQ